MISAETFRKKAEKRYNEVLRSLIRGEEPFPLPISYKRLSLTGLRIELVRAIAVIRSQSNEQLRHGLKVEWREVNTLRLVEDLVRAGRTILVFSQFVKMLHLMAGELEARNLNYLELTGQSKNRGEIVERFQAGEAPIFLISLKAGGTGLTLTAADTVIQYDPWWNPAAEQQAADRAYRIGQDKPVFHYRLIAKGTIEEKILHLQRRKQTLVDSILEGIPASQTLIDEETFRVLFAESMVDESPGSEDGL